jgi:HD domain-containing protein
MDTVTSVPAFPGTPLAVSAIEYVRACETEPVLNHSIRSYLFAALLAEHEGLRAGADFDNELLFYSCVLHDLGTSPVASGTERFEVEGADLAAAFLTGNGIGAGDVDLVWEAIALHSTPGIPDRRGPLAYLTRRGVAMDFGFFSDFISDAQGQAIHGSYPRLNMATALTDEIIRHAARGPLNALPPSIAAELIRERKAGLTTLERATRAGRWGE